MSHLSTAPPPLVSPEQAVAWLRLMLLIRRFEERSAKLYQEQKINGFCHLYSGQEPVAVGSIGVLRDDDYVITAYRDHGHALARGISPRACMAEMLGKAPGCSKGKGGSMHFFDASRNMMGGHAIVGSHIPVAAGIGLAINYRSEDKVCICYFGDGAMNQGSFHEALNMAGLWKLPVIFCVENNLIAMGTQLERSSAVLDLTARGGAPYGMPGIEINGFDIEEVGLGVRDAADRARAGEGPTFIEFKTYRLRGHSMSDPMKYRSSDEMDEAKRRDPIVAYSAKLQERGWIDEAGLEQMSDEVKDEIRDAINFAEEAPFPDPSDVYDDISVNPHIPQE